jgi:hypothetical protein
MFNIVLFLIDDNSQSWASYFQNKISVNLVRWMDRTKRWKLSVAGQNGVKCVESYPLATKVTFKIIRWFFCQCTKVESYPLPKKSDEISMTKLSHGHEHGHGHGHEHRQGHGHGHRGTRTLPEKQTRTLTQTWTWIMPMSVPVPMSLSVCVFLFMFVSCSCSCPYSYSCSC